jgi:CubicO group peptidase (beta-lactamase class C family)
MEKFTHILMKAIKILGMLGSILIALIVLGLAAALLRYPPQYVYRVLVWQESDAFDWQKFPNHPLEAAPQPYQFSSAPDPRVPAIFSQLSGAEDWEAFLEAHQTQAFIVLQGDAVLYEKYFNDTRRDSIVTSFSMAKSFTSALIGKAIQEGYIESVDEPITTYLPELASRDTRFKEITIRHLLLMASGLEYKEFRPLLFNGDDPLTTYYPDQRQLALENTHITDPPGSYFLYNKYHPQLLGMILERSTGMRVNDYLQTGIWNPLGMEFGGSWSTDSEAGDFEKMETGINARAIDFAKFGALYRDGGKWQGAQVLPLDWVEESTEPHFPEKATSYYSPYFAALPGQAYYKYMWWGYARNGEDYDFAAEGDKGQFIYVSPQKDLVIVRNGIDYGIPSQDWIKLFFDFADQF